MVLIQLGAILAILSVYFARLWRSPSAVLRSRRAPLRHRRADRVLPAAMMAPLAQRLHQGRAVQSLGRLLHADRRRRDLFWVDQLDLKPRLHDATAFPLPMYLGIGLAQCGDDDSRRLALRATIVSAMLLGADKRSAAEFSFCLAMPTMAGAFAYDLFKNYKLMTADNFTIVAVGFVTSFVAG